MNENKEDPTIIDVTPEPDNSASQSGSPDSSDPLKNESDANGEKSRRSLSPFLIVAVIVLVAAFAGGIYLSDDIKTALGLSEPTPATSAQPAPEPDKALVARISRIENRVQDLQDAPAPAAPVPVNVSALESGLADLSQELNGIRAQNQSDIAALANRIGRLESAVNQLAARPAATGDNDALAAELRSVREQLARLEQREPPSQIDAMAPMSIAAIARLRQAVERGTGFSPALDGVEQLLIAKGTIPVETGTALDNLAAHAKTGVASLPALEKDFAGAAGDIIAQDALAEDANWWDRTVATVTGAVSIRQTGDIEGNSTEARVARAEQALSAGDLNGAIDEISAINGRGAKPASAWLDQARQRASALEALDILEAFLLHGRRG